MEREDALDEIRESSHSKIKFAISDIDGVLRGKYIQKTKFLEGLGDGYGFCDVVFGWDVEDQCYDNSLITGWHTGYPDRKATIDLSTLRMIPWENDQPFFLADFELEDTAACPRSLLKKVAQKVSDLGYSPKFAQEFEWFNFIETDQSLDEKNYQNLKTLTNGMFGYSILRASQNKGYFQSLFTDLERFEIPIEGLHTETGPGVFEACIKYTDVLEAADQALLFKSAVKEIALEKGIKAIFMAKWNDDLPGCSGHLHQSLWKDDLNLFHHPSGTSKVLQHYLAGLLYCLPEVLPMYVPNINSYKRLRKGAWAPTTISWGIDNRTTAFRIIRGGPKGTRIENRVPGADMNPYLAMAASLASGLYGIENKLKLDMKEVKGNAYQQRLETLPTNLFTATERMRESEVAEHLFGSEFVDHFCRTRIWEWQQFMESITDWELRRYFEII